MNFKYDKELKELMLPVFAELGFEQSEGEIFLKEGYASKLDYNEEKKLLSLLGAKPHEGEKLEFISLSAYLFDDTHTERDLKSIVNDFEETLRQELGAKKQKAAEKVSLPSKAAAGQTPTIESFTKIFLDIYPQYRDAYKETVSQNEGFLYVNFYAKYGIEIMKELSAGGKKTEKQLSKLINFLNKHYVEGDKAVASLVTTVFFGGAFYDDNEKIFETAVLPKLEGMSYLSQAAVHSIAVVKNDKKIRAMFEGK